MKIMVLVKRVGFYAGILSLAALFVLGGVEKSSAAESTWERIKRTGVLRSGVLDAPPYWWREGGGEWKGAMVEMSKDIADALGARLELVDVGGWGQTVLQLNSDKTDMQFSLQATPARAKAIDFAGPAYYIAFVMVNKTGFKAATWADYNASNLKIAVETGSASETILRKQAPKSAINGFTKLPEALLSVKAGHTDAFVTTSMTGLIQRQVNPDLGEIVTPTPIVQLPGYIGVRQDVGDTRFRDFLNWWCEWNVLLGHNEAKLKAALNQRGITDIPEHVRF
jgi:polar amino acid transport system substrate-binding protein